MNAVKNLKDYVLVTGSHCSGSTWVGRMLALSAKVGYIHEPLNKSRKRSHVQYWFPYADKNQLGRLDSDVALQLSEQIEKFRVSKLLDYVYYYRDPKKWLRLYKQQRALLLNHKVIIKDPIALFSSEFIAKKYDAKVVLLVRHPAAFVKSILDRGWTFDFNEFLNQDLLMSALLQEYEAEITEAANDPSMSLIDQAILLWNIFHYAILKYQAEYENWIVVTHEALSMNPIPEFELLYKKLGLDFSPSIARKIMRYTSSEVTTSRQRNSVQNAKKWKSVLPAVDVEKIRSKTETIASNFYGDDSW